MEAQSSRLQTNPAPQQIQSLKDKHSMCDTFQLIGCASNTSDIFMHHIQQAAWAATYRQHRQHVFIQAHTIVVVKVNEVPMECDRVQVLPITQPHLWQQTWAQGEVLVGMRAATTSGAGPAGQGEAQVRER